jgi:DegV family protein with EDD domain
VTVRIVVDSTSDIGAERAKQHRISVVPLTVSFGTREYLDGIDLDTETFYEKLVSSPTLPKTSLPSGAHFEDAYRAQIADGATGIVTITISSELSGTLNIATLAAQRVSEETGIPIRLVDSHSVSAGIGLPAIIAADRAAAGASIDEVVTLCQSLFDRSKLTFVLDTLEYLQKGGRIGRAKAVVGTILNIKPLLTIKDGIVAPLEQARSRGKALARMTELLKAMGPLEYAAVAASDDQTAAEFYELTKNVFDGDVPIFKLGAVVGTHAGPHAGGVLAIAATR